MFLKKTIVSLLTVLVLIPLPVEASLDFPQDYKHKTEVNYLFDREFIDAQNYEELRLRSPITYAEGLKIALVSAKPKEFTKKELSKLKKGSVTLSKITEDHWAFPYFVHAETNGILSNPETTMNPDRFLMRKEGLQLLLLIQNVQLPTKTIKLFGDVPPKDPFYPYFAYAYETNLLSTLPTNHYRPNEFISREEFMIIAYRLIFLKHLSNSFEIIPTTYSCNATFYSDFFEGRNTASGVPFHQNMATAAHLKLPFGTKIEIIYPENKKSIIVEINDRGPFDDRFCLDLSRSAFEKLAPVSRGWIPIEYWIIN